MSRQIKIIFSDVAKDALRDQVVDVGVGGKSLADLCR